MTVKNKRIEYRPEGFVLRKKRFLVLWDERLVKWNEIKAIRAVMWDCFSAHAFGYRLILSESESVCMTDLDDEFKDFEKALRIKFPDIDESVLDKVQSVFPDETELICWKTEKSQPEVSANLVNSVRSA